MSLPAWSYPSKSIHRSTLFSMYTALRVVRYGQGVLVPRTSIGRKFVDFECVKCYYCSSGEEWRQCNAGHNLYEQVQFRTLPSYHRLFCTSKNSFLKQNSSRHPFELPHPSSCCPQRKYAKSQIFTAVTSASSAEYIAVSSILTYDIYQTHFNPKVPGKMLIKMAHLFVIVQQYMPFY